MEFALFGFWMFYLAPWLVAEIRRHPSPGAVLALNAAAGWTIAGWVVALLWAIRPDGAIRPARKRTASVYLVQPPSAAAVPASARRRTVLAMVAAAAAAGFWLPGGSVSLSASPSVERVAAAGVSLLAAPSSDARVVGSLPAACAVHVVEMRRGWKRVWRTSDCAADFAGRSSGWVPSFATRAPFGS